MTQVVKYTMKVKVIKYFLQIFVIWNNGAEKKWIARYTFWYIVLLTLCNGDRRIVHWISKLKSILLKSQPGGEMASSSRGFPTERLDACLGQFSREDNPTFTFSTVNFPNGVLKRRTIRLQLSLFPDENKAKEMNPSCFSDCRLAQCSLACSHHIHCSHLLHPQVLVVACFTFVVKKNYLTHLHTTCSI